MRFNKNKIKFFLLFFPLALSLLLSAGCATRLDSSVAPGINLNEIKTIFVKKLPADGRGVEKLIAQELSRMGFQAVHGPVMPTNYTFDAIVEYQDKWMWDITMYMIELRVQVLDPNSRFKMASGQSYRTSLARKSPPEMVKEVLTEVFK
jgi:hypothetical protein